jgi:hypothetical protein
MADFIDLMGFAKGQQQANKENWQDTIYDINTRNAEENLRQSQTRFDLALPSMQFGQEESYKAALGNRAGQEFQTNVLTEAGKLPPEQREQFIADSAIRRLQTLDPAAPGAAQERNSIENFLKVQAGGISRTNPQAAAALYGAMTLGGSTADALRQEALLSDPKTAFDPINLAAMANQMGGQYDQATNSVRLGGSGGTMPVEQFVNFARQRAMDQTADLTPGMQRADNQAQLSTFADQQIEEFRKIGILAMKNPVTNQVIPMFNIQTGQAIPQDAQGLPAGGAPGGAPMSMAPWAGGGINPLAGTVPQYAQNMPAVQAMPTMPGVPAAPQGPGFFTDPSGRVQLLQPFYNTANWARGIEARSQLPNTAPVDPYQQLTQNQWITQPR